MTKLAEQNTYPLLGINISPYSKEEFFNQIELQLHENGATKTPMFVVTVNPEIVIQSIIDNEFKEILCSTSINTADGIGIRWAIKYLYGKEIERITGSDSIEKICELCARYNQTVFFYGAKPTVADRAAKILKQKIEFLPVAGTYSPDSYDLPLENMPLEKQDQIKGASVILVALGAPAQEKWIHDNLSKLPNCKLIIGIGGSFDFIAGTIKRAPRWLQKSGLEWLYRLYNQPSRWRRMLKLPLFALNIILLKISNGRGMHNLPKTL